MKLSRGTWIGIAMMGVIAIVVGVILFSMSSAPTKRTVELERVKVADVATSRAKVDQQLAAIRKAGEPILLADFVAKPVPPEQNAAEPLMAAMKWLDKKEYNDDPYWNLDFAPTYTPAQEKIINDAVVRFAPALALIDQSDGRTGVDWKITMKTPTVTILLPSLNGARQLANLLVGAVQSSHRAGRDDEAVHRITQMTLLVRHTDRHIAMVGHLVAAGISRLQSLCMSYVVPTLKIGTKPGDATPEQVSALITAMLDPSTLENGFVYSALSERMFMYDTFQSLIDGKMTSSQLEQYMSGSKTASTSRDGSTPAELWTELPILLEHARGVVAACKADRLPEFKAIAPKTLDVKLPESLMFSPPFDRFADTHFMGLTYLRLNAVALAVRWYACEHDGAMPATLDELVPKYLPAIPGDPLVAAPGVVQFRTGGDPAVFSAGTAPASGGRKAASTKPAKPNEVAVSLKATR